MSSNSKLKTSAFAASHSAAPARRLQNLKLQKLAGLLLTWFSTNARDLPWRRTRDPYAIWVSEIMLQQTQVKTVIPYWKRWLATLPTIEAAAHASPDRIHKLWEGLGYYTRARNLQRAAKQIVSQQHAVAKSRRRRGNESQTKRKPTTPHVVSYNFPQNFDDVLALPGIGRYTAGAICSIAFNQPTPILDGNVIRVLARVFGIAENPKEKETNARLWKLAAEFVAGAAKQQTFRSSRREEAHSKIGNSQSLLTSAATITGNCSALNQSLMELGALVCTPRNPQCRICPVKKLCVALLENRVNELPNPGKRQVVTARRFIAFVIERNGKFLVRQRPVGVVNAHLWEFPNVEIGARLSEPQHTRSRNTAGKIPATSGIRARCGSGDPRSELVANAARQTLGFTPKTLQPLCTIKHSITRYRITLEAFQVRLGRTSYTSPHSKPAKSGTRITPSSKIGVWKTPAQMRQLAFTAAHKKLASAAFNSILSAR